MKSCLAAGLLILLAQSSLADEALAQASGCTACHKVDTKLVGPSYQEVAARYRGDAEAKTRLAAKVRSGTVGNWGQVMMPPNTTVSDADLDKLISWILGL